MQSKQRAADALDKAVYFLDRSLAPKQKVRAFQRAKLVVELLAEDELLQRCTAGTLTELEGIGPSSASVISAGVLEQQPEYLTKLEASSQVPVGMGEELRSQLRGDCHVHTTWSDGGADLADMVRTAEALGHEYVVITDHSPRLTIAHGLNPERLEQQLDAIDGLRQTAEITVLTGMEVDILEDGTLDLSEELLERLDVVVASVHSKLAQPAPEMTERLLKAVSHPLVTILGHCTGRQILGTQRAPSQFDALAVFELAAASTTAIEINCRPERQDPPEDLLALARDTGCLFAINTDAHAPGQLEWQSLGCDKAARYQLSAERIINTWPAADLLRWSRGRGALAG
jgi:putative hydrolase